jgi:ribonuclease E
MRMWETVRDLTLKSQAPTLVYEEGSLIKRSIRDLYNKDIDEILVAGEAGYQEARDFMRMLMPSHAQEREALSRRPAAVLADGRREPARRDVLADGAAALRRLHRHQPDRGAGFDRRQLRPLDPRASHRGHRAQDQSRGAEEVARQLRLRDLAGLIVIDFIDMDEKRNNRSVERKLKDCLKHDRARIQVGRISHFGLLEMSRQRVGAARHRAATSHRLIYILPQVADQISIRAMRSKGGDRARRRARRERSSRMSPP